MSIRLKNFYTIKVYTATHPQNLSTEVSFYGGRGYICDWCKCGSWLLWLECADKLLIFAVLKQWLLQQRETGACFLYNRWIIGLSRHCKVKKISCC